MNATNPLPPPPINFPMPSLDQLGINPQNFKLPPAPPASESKQLFEFL